MFLCPECKVRLARSAAEGAVVWTCPDCGGHAVGLAVLRKVTARDAINQFWQKTINSTHTGNRACPACQSPMHALPMGAPSNNFYLDVCKRCQFVWFDPNELESLPPAPAPPSEPEERLPQKAREALALLKVRQMAEQDSGFGTNPPDEWWKYIPAMLNLPVEDDNPVTHPPWATFTLALLIIVASIAGFTDLKETVSNFGFVPSEILRGGGLTLLTSFFLHAGILHLAGNIYFLLVFGDNVEDVLGWKRYLLLVLAATVGGNILHALFAPNPTTPCIGASGGISALIVFYALQFPHARLGFWMRFQWVQMPAYAALILWIAYQFFILHHQVYGLSKVSALAHIGGATIGFLYWWKINKWQPTKSLSPNDTRTGSAAPPLRG